MFNPVDLFKQRLTEHIKLINRYLRYIFNGHFMIALSFTIIMLAIYYQKWLENLSDDFPAAFVIALALGFLVSYNPIQSFLKKPDKVFLIVKEEEMHRYFRLTLLYNFFVQLYVVLIVSAAVVPLYAQAFPGKTKLDYVLLLVIILVVKGWNMVTNWYMLKIRNPRIRMVDKLIRGLIGIAFFYFFLQEQFFVIIAILYFIVVINNYFLARKQSGLAWDLLIENDQNRLALFYRFVSMFAEVPQLTKRLRKRRMLASFIQNFIPFTHTSTYDYLYRLTFIRSSDYLSLYVRLIIIGGAIILFVPNVWLKIIFALLFIYMSNFQMITLYHHYQTNIWLDLYPVNLENRKKSFIKWVSLLTLIQTVIFAAVFFIWFDIGSVVLTFAAGSIFNYLFNYGYVKRKIEKASH
ncbi:ABC transporter permease [Pseudogracilibacillus auburnensis]|uniref:ABC-2 type transport system permease protein n=1 Tax=Pseudogracilibacillus auburnensis TaxID=1494959 RepID=A0A2V3W451_9BACI|nr:ABC transporter permease [Pseudogracilibacillus auburnensis]MBO1002939.1 ABC transporter permease [Pseudogracilibacillus auburnensis]PXW87035.1 ABC-2 type transport system permease protein [Pseudogracilibacillus auburnensis]